MRSRAQIKGHPLHPMMIAFPVAFTVGALLADLAGWLGDWPSLWTTGGYLSIAAVPTGLAAGLPGFIDYVAIVPPNSSAQKRATNHMLVNLTALGMFILGWMFRDFHSFRPGLGTIICEIIGIVFISMGGWLGGTLVYRNQISVDHRYAEAGKWREIKIDGTPGESADVPGAHDLQAGHMMLVHANGHRILLARLANGFAACDDRCTHRGGPLSDGTLIGNIVACPWHGSQFDVTTGKVNAGPADQTIKTHEIQINGSRVSIKLPAKAD
ncbi:MAG: DUF2231 domain-containing protein [Gemmataceae bacterium]